MKNKVLAFYGFLFAITLMLMIFQFARYGSITGYLNSGKYGEGGNVKITNEQGFALSLIEPPKMIASSGSGKTGFLKVLNSGTSVLTECGMIGEGKFGSWIINSENMTLKPGESALYGFNIKVPSEAETGMYAIPFIFLCNGYDRKGVIDVKVAGQGKESDAPIPVTSSLTVFSMFDIGSSGSYLISFVLIGLLLVLFIGIYMYRRHRRAEKISRIEKYGRKLIRLNLNS